MNKWTVTVTDDGKVKVEADHVIGHVIRVRVIIKAITYLLDNATTKWRDATK